jgi:aspartyl-tRNA(Asn)/glutamyl-tRNA(Gln) amidotransferase subunit A
MTAWHALDYRALRAAYAAGEVTPVQVVQGYLDRIAAHNPALRLILDVDSAGALTAAADSMARFGSGTARALEGLPMAVKANIAVAGLGWSAGMALRADIIAGKDAEAVRRLREAGAIIIGTANMHEAALGGTNDNIFYGRAINPHKAGYTTGGSSGGSGGAVAAGLCTAALGSDTLGSVRIPAAYNGIYGLKPTHGAISGDGMVPLCPWLEDVGILTRSLDDVADIQAVLGDGEDVVRSELTRLLVLTDGPDCEPAVLEAYHRAQKLLGDKSQYALTLKDNAADIRLAGFTFAARSLADQLGDIPQTAPEKLSAELRYMLRYAASRSAEDLARAEAILQRVRDQLLVAIGDDGLLLTPTTPQAAFLHSGRPPVTGASYTGLANIAGLPALSVPAGVNDDGLPVAVQLIGPAGSETRLIAAARTLEIGLGGFVPSPILDNNLG